MRRVKKKRDGYDLLDHIKKRPEFYLTSPTLSSLKDFLAGLSVGGYFLDHPEHDIFSWDYFSAWFCIHLDAPGAAGGGWYRAILAESTDEKKGFTRFFEYLEAFRKRAPVIECLFTLTPAQRKFYAARRSSKAPTQLRLRRYKGERCLFLEAKWHGQRGWGVHTGYHSFAQARRSLAETFRVTDTQWQRAKKNSGAARNASPGGTS